MPITNALSAADIQRRGMAAIAESLKRGKKRGRKKSEEKGTDLFVCEIRRQ
jgi:hypothetical protein